MARRAGPAGRFGPARRLRVASDGGLVLEGRSEKGGFYAIAAVPANEEAFALTFFVRIG